MVRLNFPSAEFDLKPGGIGVPMIQSPPDVPPLRRGEVFGREGVGD